MIDFKNFLGPSGHFVRHRILVGFLVGASVWVGDPRVMAAPATAASSAVTAASTSAVKAVQDATREQLQRNAQLLAQEQAQVQLLQAQVDGQKLQARMQQNKNQAEMNVAQSQQQAQAVANTLERQRQVDQISDPSLYFLPPLKTPSDVRAPIGSIVHNRYPMTSSEINYTLQQARDAQAAAMSRPKVEIVNPILHATIGPGAKIPTVTVAPGYVVSLSVVDRGGNPWPITSKSVGGGQQFDVQAPFQTARKGAAPPTQKGVDLSQVQDSLMNRIPDNMLTVTTPSYGTDTNMMLTLKGLTVPVMVHLKGTQPTPGPADGMVTLQIDNAQSPDAQKPLVESIDQGLAPQLTPFLAQTPPQGAIPLQVSAGAPLQAWEWNGLVILRTTQPLRSPAWRYEATLGNVYAYAIAPASVVLIRQPDGSEQDYEILPPPGGFGQTAGAN